MVKINIDLQGDPLIPAGRDLIANLVGAHIAAADEEELLHMVGVALSEVHSSNIAEALRIVTHAAYHAQDLIVRLLNVAAERGIALESSLIGSDGSAEAGQRIRAEALELWASLKDGGA